MKNKLIILLIMLLSINSICALGVTPGRTTIDFQPGLHKEVSFSIINSEHKEMSVLFFVRGELNESITLNQVYADFFASDDSKTFTYTIDLPNELDKFGKYEAEIVALEAPKDAKQGGTFVGATVSVVTQLHVQVPYPDKNLEAELNILEYGEDGNVVFLLPVYNRGSKNIEKVEASIEIYSSDGKKVTTLKTNSQSLDSLKRTELIASWTPDPHPEKYNAVVTVTYDSETTTVSKEFNVGQMLLVINEIVIKDFELGGIAKFETYVENKWPSDLYNAHINIVIYDSQEEKIADFKSPMYEIGALEKEVMVSYWDTADVVKGTYKGKIILKYSDRSTDRDVDVIVDENSIEIVGITGHVVVQGKGLFNLTNLLIILIGFLILGNIVWFLKVKRLRKKK